MSSLKGLGVFGMGVWLGLLGCGKPAGALEDPETPTPADAKAFVDGVDAELKRLWIAQELASWDYSTDIRPETEAKSASSEEAVMGFLTKSILESTAYSKVEGLDAETSRKLHLLKTATSLPAPDDAAKRKELAEIVSKLGGMYGTGKACDETGNCRDLGDLEKVLSDAASQGGSYDTQLEAWEAWRTVSPPMKGKYMRFVELANEGAGDIGFGNVGEMWRSGYDMEPAALEMETDRLWQQVKPLYEALHCHVRAKLVERYGTEKVNPGGMIPAHLTGNMWSQSWENLYPMLEPYPGQPSLDITKALQEKEFDELKMVKTAEGFFTSLGLDPLPETFWERSMFKKPEGKEVVCHASAWDPNFNDDLRIKMCIRVTMEDFVTIHHELGHNYYYHYYYTQPALFQQGAHDGFHEGVGDTLALSITPAYLNKIGLMEAVSDSPESVINKQMLDALSKIAFMPFGRMIDQWRWDVFSGQITPDNYNQGWWDLRAKYQGISPPGDRKTGFFDPGAKYHIPGNTPYLRYFLAHILQFQFHKSLCEVSGHEGPLHECSIYGSTAAGDRLRNMLALGASQPWPDALDAITGQRTMDADPMVEYFTPLMNYLEKQNSGRSCGWTDNP